MAGYGGSRADCHGIVEGLLAGAFYSTDIGPGTPEQELLDAFYLLQLPLNALRDQPMVGYQERSAWRKVLYGDGSFVEVDFRSLAHRVVVGGQAIVENFVCMAPGRRPGAYILYVSPMAETWIYLRKDRWPCPPHWRGRGFLEATELTPSGEGPQRRLSVEDGQLVLDIPAGVPYRLTAAGSPDP